MFQANCDKYKVASPIQIIQLLKNNDYVRPAGH